MYGGVINLLFVPVTKYTGRNDTTIEVFPGNAGGITGRNSF